ncbi:MAG: hypothetical protein LBU41_03355, partial [Clostridiales Family XIII bacterium]|nr:hypothetical protein [Clostridiales Family XIII bacterium]
MNQKLIELYIVGAGAFGRETADTIHEINAVHPTFQIKGFIDDWAEIQGTAINGIPVLGKFAYLIEMAKTTKEKPHAVVTVANPQAKEKLVQKLDEYVIWENVIHPTAII